MTKRPRTLFWTRYGQEVGFHTGHEDILVKDIAHSLSMQCRFGGHCFNFYSVAEHSINVAKLLPAMYKREALLHDAGEAYTTDLPTPIKNMVPEFSKIEEVFLKKIGLKFEVDLCNLHPLVKQADYLMLRKEAMLNTTIPQEIIDSFTSTFCDAVTADMILEEAGIELNFWKPPTARDHFLDEFKNIFPDYKFTDKDLTDL